MDVHETLAEKLTESTLTRIYICSKSMIGSVDVDGRQQPASMGPLNILWGREK